MGSEEGESVALTQKMSINPSRTKLKLVESAIASTDKQIQKLSNGSDILKIVNNKVSPKNRVHQMRN